MNATPEDLRFTGPLYTVSEAASYLGVPRSTFSSWLRVASTSAPQRPALNGRPLVTSIEGSRLTVPFVGLAEGMVVAAFRDTGLPLARIRPALERLAGVCGPDHPLASERLAS